MVIILLTEDTLEEAQKKCISTPKRILPALKKLKNFFHIIRKKKTFFHIIRKIDTVTYNFYS